MPRLVRTRLSAMMFLFYPGLGAWAITTGTYLLSSPLKGGLNFTTGEVGWIYSTFAIGAVVANPFVGLLADRLFRAERVFAVAGVVCAAFLFASGWWCDANAGHVEEVYRIVAADQTVNGEPVLDVYARHAGGTQPETVVAALNRVNEDPRMRAAARGVFWPLFALMMGQTICLQIALPLTTVLCMRNLADPSHQFSRTRLFGTIGWMAVGIGMGYVVDTVSAEPFFLAGGITLVASVYVVTLPATPPKGTGKTLGEAFGLPAFVLFRDRSFVVFLVVALLTAQMNQFYGVYGHRYLTDAGFARPEQWMTLGQAAEVVCMFLIPVLKPKKTMKWLMFLGVAGGAVRGAAMAWGPDWLVLGLGVPMHGWSFALYFIVAATFIDREAPPHLRASAQAIVAFVASGIGPWTGNLMAAATVNHFRTGTVIDWSGVWVVPLIGCAVASVVFAAGFRTPPEHRVTPPPGSAPGR
jgi:MFS family permease